MAPKLRVEALLSRRPLSQQLALLVIATALPILIASAIMFNRLVANERQGLRQSLMVSARTLASLVDNEINTHAAIASTLAFSPNLQKGDLAAFWTEAKQALEFVPGSWLALSTPDGPIVLNTLASFGTAFPRHAAPDVVRRGFETGQPQVGDLLVGPVAKRQISFVEVPVFRDGLPTYSISVALPPERMLGLMTRQFDHGEVVGVLDRNRRFVARIPDHEQRLGGFDYAASHLGVIAGQYVAVAISDNGTGMTPEVLSRAFDPFFTTKDVDKGTGLGLSQVFGFVTQSGGHAKIYSELGEGTTVKLYFPRTTQPEAKSIGAQMEAQEISLGRSSEIILVVEDEENVRCMVVEALRDLGYTVAHASSGAHRLSIVEELQAVDLLLTDVVMPGMSGPEMASRLQSQRPEMKVLYMTGYTRNAVIHDGRLDAHVNLLPKPFAIDQLATKVRSMLDARA